MSGAVPVRVVVRFGPSGGLTPWIAGSLGVHLAASLAMSAYPLLVRHPKRSFESATIVALAGAPPPPARVSAPAAPPPSAVHEAPAARPPTGPSAVKEIPKPAKKKDEPKPKAPPAASKPPAEPPSPPTPAPAGPAAPSATPGAGGPGITALDVVDASLAWYHDTVSAALDRNWIRPPLEEHAGTVYTVVVAFEIAKDGSVRQLRVESSSGVQVVDLSAVRAVRDSAPFPPPPPGRREETVRSRVRFEYDPGRD